MTWGAAHPRSRGEHLNHAQMSPYPGGSSPLARGTLPSGTLVLFRPRLIPARAGNTRIFKSSLLSRAAHPRSRGEHRLRFRFFYLFNGSSPLARGTRGVASSEVGGVRLIPARAGNTGISENAYNELAAHPRSRGEHRMFSQTGETTLGSSPLARGTRRGNRNLGKQRRLIPARAGNTMYSLYGLTGGTAHPRSRGEHCISALWP